ncbi:MAG TPA: Rrf2 family transcriptional regulator [Verrucomicrobiae bacterium]|nr:Rrf2 family transcriptional regulator [Verrucomicrobiae bacterium]
MMLTRFSDYALRVLMFAALRPERSFSVTEVAEAYQLSRNHLAKVVNHLVHTGHLRARRGRKGGVWLGCDPSAVRLGSLVRLTENDSPLVECFGAGSNRCRLAPACRLKGALAQALEAFYGSLDGCTLADLVEQPVKLRKLLEETR